MKASTKEQRCIDEWNRVYPIGTHVMLERENGINSPTTTRSEAVLGPDGKPGIYVTGETTLYPLGSAQPVTQ